MSQRAHATVEQSECCANRPNEKPPAILSAYKPTATVVAAARICSKVDMLDRLCLQLIDRSKNGDWLDFAVNRAAL
jgi:hypothetical protein